MLHIYAIQGSGKMNIFSNSMYTIIENHKAKGIKAKERKQLVDELKINLSSLVDSNTITETEAEYTYSRIKNDIETLSDTEISTIVSDRFEQVYHNIIKEERKKHFMQFELENYKQSINKRVLDGTLCADEAGKLIANFSQTLNYIK